MVRVVLGVEVKHAITFLDLATERFEARVGRAPTPEELTWTFDQIQVSCHHLQIMFSFFSYYWCRNVHYDSVPRAFLDQARNISRRP